MNFHLQDNWSDFPHYNGKRIAWKKVNNPSKKIVFCSSVNDQEWQIRMNNFPDEPLYTLIVDGAEIIHFNDWPTMWSK